MRRREFVGGLASTIIALPSFARAQSATLPVVGFVYGGSNDPLVNNVSAFRKGLNELGYVEDRNVAVEYHWLNGQYDRIPMLIAELVRRRVAVIVTPSTPAAALAAKGATRSIPIVFSAAQDPVQLGLVASLSRPGGNVTGIDYFSNQITAKRLSLLHELLPKAVRIAVLINPANAPNARATLKELQETAPAIGLQLDIINATTISEIDTAFAKFADIRPDAIFIGGDAFLYSRRRQIAISAMREKIATAFASKEAVVDGGLMSYSTDIVDMNYQVGIYTGRVLKGEKPADMPVLQQTKFLFTINIQTARALGIDVRPAVLSVADEVIE